MDGIQITESLEDAIGDALEQCHNAMECSVNENMEQRMCPAVVIYCR